MSSLPEGNGLSQETQQALMAQYRECFAHHQVMYQLMWQVPAVTLTISGLLVGAAFGYDLPAAARLVGAANRHVHVEIPERWRFPWLRQSFQGIAAHQL